MNETDPTVVAEAAPPDVGLVSRRSLIDEHVEVRFTLSPGDRPLVAAGETVVAGAPIAERLRDARLDEVVVPGSALPHPGGRVANGELLFDWHGRWRVATGDLTEPLESPVAGIVREVRPGSSITVRTGGRAMHGVVALGGPTRGRLRIATGKDGELRSGGLDVGYAGSILVVGSRIDAETLTRARAMGVRGVIVSGFASKERRDFSASERRQRAALHRLASIRRPRPGWSAAPSVLGARAGRPRRTRRA